MGYSSQTEVVSAEVPCSGFLFKTLGGLWNEKGCLHRTLLCLAKNKKKKKTEVMLKTLHHRAQQSTDRVQAAVDNQKPFILASAEQWC